MREKENLTEKDLEFLGCCLDLAEEAYNSGDQPFGSILVSGDGRILAEERNFEPMILFQ